MITRGKGGGRSLPYKSVLAIVALALAACAPRDEVPTFLVVRKPFRHQVTALGNLKAAKVTRLTVPQEVKGTVRLAWLASEGRLEEGDVVARFDPAMMRDRLREGRLDRDSARLEVAKARLQSDGKVADFDTSLQVADLELGLARRYQKTDDSVFSRHEIIESEIDEELAGERREHAKISRETEKVRGRTEVEILEIKKRKAQLEIDQAEKGLDALEVRAPHGGLFTLARNWRGEPLEAGSEMWRGQPIGELPDLTLMEAEVFVLEADAGGLETGKGATVTVEAHPEKAFPARIRLVDAVAKPRFRGSPVQYFGVTLELESADGLPMKPGHRVRAALLLEEIGEALVLPRQAVFTQGGEHRVYVKNGSGFTARKVEIGAKSVGLVVVISGLDGGEVIALRRPVDLEEETKDAGTEVTQSQ
ncbi:MAG: HlyD family efflux transporter periplasmic adaptor subunit [Acidobacteria bacterium]|nr:HlyD family efflux transporter periplasmic adaptor subunit [Acidobacteriota bacterium]